MSKVNFFLLVVFFFFFAPKVNGQHENNELFLVHKKNFDKISKIKESISRNKRLIEVLDTMIHYFPNINLYNSLDNQNTEIFNNYSKYQNDVKKVPHLNLILGNSLLFKRKPIESLTYLFEAEKAFENLKDYNCQIFTLLRISSVFTHYTDSPAGLPYIEKTICIARNINDVALLSQSLTYKGDYYMTRNQYKLALPSFYEISALKNVSKKHKIVNNFNLGFSFYKLGKEKEGINLLENTLRITPDDYADYQINVRQDLIKIYIEKDNLLKANEHLKKLKYYTFYPNIYSNDSLRYSLYDYQIQKGLGNYKTALKYLEFRRVYEDSVNKNQTAQQVEGIKSQLTLKEQTEKLQKSENEKLKSENERQNQFRWFLIAISAIGLLSTIYVFLTNKKLKNSNSQLLEKNKEISEAMLKGQTIERQRVALDLHDNLGSTLSALWLSIDMIDKSKMNDEEKEIHQNLRENLEKAYNDVRLLSHNLLPEEFEKQGLATTLQGFVRKINKSSTIKFDLKIDEDFGRVNNKIEFELYSICLELVNNIMKHSKATEAKIELSRTEKQIKLIVSDNGIGTFMNESDGKGMKNVKARVESLNGTWDLQNIENQGVINEVLVLI